MDEQKPPEYLYRYRSLSTAQQIEFVERTLALGEHYFAAASSFNDPFDCAPVYSIDATPEEIRSYYEVVFADDPHVERKIRHLLEAKSNNPELFARHMLEARRELERDIKSTLGIYCLSEVGDHVLMWSHYADCHRGICLRFNRSKNQDVFSVAQRVEYVDERPVVNLVRDTKRDKYFKALLTKASDWRYEREWRLFDRRGPGVHLLPSNAIDAVILGAHISDTLAERFQKLVASRPDETVLLRGHIDPDLFRIQIRPA